MNQSKQHSLYLFINQSKFQSLCLFITNSSYEGTMVNVNHKDASRSPAAATTEEDAPRSLRLISRFITVYNCFVKCLKCKPAAICQCVFTFCMINVSYQIKVCTKLIFILVICRVASYGRYAHHPFNYHCNDIAHVKIYYYSCETKTKSDVISLRALE